MSDDNSKPSYEFNPRSPDAMFATILSEIKNNHKVMTTRMDAQDQKLGSIEDQAFKTNGRVTGLEAREREQKIRLSAYAGSASVAGLGLWQLLKLAWSYLSGGSSS